jgi:hypothetical protein
MGPACYFGGFAIMSTKVPITVAHGDGIGPGGAAGYTLSQGQ